jgi:CheY-like chemotaxis protein
MIRVLIVDDDEDDRDLFCIAVHEIEPRTHCIMARNGEEALQGLRLEEYPKPHIIFLDLNMPRINGFQCLRELKKDRELQDIPVVIYTTSKVEEDRQEIKNFGAVHYISKPSSFTELCSIISNVFEKEMIRAKYSS